MAWTETDPMKERLHFVTDWDRRLYTVTELCARYGVSRKTGYKWLARYADVGVAGLAERSRAPHRCPHRIAPAVAAAIVETRRQHPSWGPRKLLVWLADHRSGLELPAASTAGDLLHRPGRGGPRRRPRARLLPHRPPWAVRDERPVEPPRDRPTAHPAESSGRERRPRTDAPHAEGRDDPAARPHAPRPAAPLSALPHGVQSRAAPTK